MTRLWLVLLLLVLSALTAYADDDIVYAARYYLPPSSKGTSHFHLYRINPDGTGKRQLTFGKYNYDNPQWSPNGRYIVFVRDQKALCILDVRTSRIKTLVSPDREPAALHTTYDFDSVHWMPDAPNVVISSFEGGDEEAQVINVQTRQERDHIEGANDYLVSPDGKSAFFVNGGHIAVERIIKHRGFIVSEPDMFVQDAAWISNKAFGGITSKSESKQVYLAVFNQNGVQKRRVLCRWPNVFKLPKNQYRPENDPYIDSINAGRRNLSAWIHSNRDIVYVQDVGTSGTSPDYDYWRADTITGKMTKITNGQFLAWSPDGQQFCTSPFHNFMDYGKTGKNLYVTSLEIGSVKSDNLREIVTGLVWVTGADWRRHSR